MTEIKLSKRMKAVADMVDGERVADIGCDHAFVSMYLIQKGIAKKVFAMDVKKGPMEIAKSNISLYGMDKNIETRLSDGFDKLAPDEADCAIIAGMGGELINAILSRGKIHTDKGIHLVLQPQSEPWKVREYLYSIGYEIVGEDMLIEDDKYYVIIKAVPATDTIKEYSYAELVYGRLLIENKHPVLINFIKRNIEKNIELFKELEHINTEKSATRRDKLAKEIEFDKQMLESFGR